MTDTVTTSAIERKHGTLFTFWKVNEFAFIKFRRGDAQHEATSREEFKVTTRLQRGC